MKMIKVITYTTSTKKKPFVEWLEELDKKAQSIVATRVDRLSFGNFGDCKQLKNAEGVWELCISYGPGYRVYFGKLGAQIVLLLVGGDKGSQTRDIVKAKRYWLEYRESSHE